MLEFRTNLQMHTIVIVKSKRIYSINRKRFVLVEERRGVYDEIGYTHESHEEMKFRTTNVLCNKMCAFEGISEGKLVI